MIFQLVYTNKVITQTKKFVNYINLDVQNKKI
jgi:hypothetical protein